MANITNLIIFTLLIVISFNSPISAESAKLEIELLKTYDDGIGEAIHKLQKLDSDLKIIIASEKDFANRYQNYDKTATETVAYQIDQYPMLFVLQGFSGSGADDNRSFHISKAEFHEQEDKKFITLVIEKSEITYPPYVSVVGTCDVRYMNYLVLFDGLYPGNYEIQCTLKTTHIQRNGNRPNPVSDRILKIEEKRIKTFYLELKP